MKRDQTAARKYFHRIARDHSLGLNSAAALKALLGTAWRRDYHGLLEYISRDQFSVIGRQPLGSGAHGSVYPATWKQPCGLLSEGVFDCQIREVVLKQLFDESMSLSKSRESLFKEVSFFSPFSCIRINENAGNTLAVLFIATQLTVPAPSYTTRPLRPWNRLYQFLRRDRDISR